jgi:serine/threonine-protein kinase
MESLVTINKTIIMNRDDSTEKSEESITSTQTLGFTHKSDTVIDTNAVTEAKIEFHKQELENIYPLQDIYDIKEEFAEGGQGIISKGKDKVLKRYVAIKSLKSNYFENEQVIKNFITEAKITAQLDHPSIIPLYSIHSSAVDKGLHISMKLIHGHTLKELIEDTALLCMQYRKTKIREIEQSVLKERLEDFLKVCDAISFAHNRNVVHRDLKPDNIMIGEFHEVYVMDWGIAIPYNKDKNNDNKDKNVTISGTPGYIAPELVVGGTPTPRSDQYSLGMILFELMTLSPGITGNDVEEVFYKTRDGQLEPMVHRFDNCRISKDLAAIVQKAIAINPEDRYPSVEAMADDIRHFILNEETEARPDNLLRKCSRWGSKHKSFVATLIMITLLCLAGVTIYSLIKKNRAEKDSKVKALKMVALHSNIEDNAHSIDRHFFHISHILGRFADNTIAALEEENIVTAKNYYPTSDFTKIKKLPPGTIYSPAYKRNINLTALNYTLVPGLNFADTKLQIEKIATLQPHLFRYLVNSDPDAMTFENIPEGGMQAIIKGCPIRWIYVALKNGLMISYPGSIGPEKGYDPRTRPWYRNAATTKRQKWSKPYIDAFGLGVVISVSRSLYGFKGNFYGVASLDMTFEYIANTLMKPKAHHKSVIARYLINGDGDIILSSHLASRKIKKAEQTDSEIQFRPFPYPEIKQYINKKNSGQFETVQHGRTVMIGYAPIKTLGWYYVEEVNLKQYLTSE